MLAPLLLVGGAGGVALLGSIILLSSAGTGPTQVLDWRNMLTKNLPMGTPVATIDPEKWSFLSLTSNAGTYM